MVRLWSGNTDITGLVIGNSVQQNAKCNKRQVSRKGHRGSRARTSVATSAVWLAILSEIPLAYLWSPYGIGQTIIFLPCGYLLSFFLSFFIPRLISAAADWMSAILPHMVWP